MPYIKQEDRKKFSTLTAVMNEMIGVNGITPGELNYLVTTLCREYMKKKGESYAYYNDVIGVLENVKQELYRRKISKYEDKKISENGDCYNE